MTNFPQPRGRHATCHEMSDSRKDTKLKRKERTFPLYAHKLWGWPQTIPPFKGFIYIAVAPRQNEEFIPRARFHALPHTNPRHTLLSCTILLAWLIFKHLLFK